MVSFGAVLGANTRFIIFKQLEKLNLSKDFFILIINTFSSFCCGYLITFLPSFASLTLSDQLVLFLLIGFLGSLSSFSTFVYDLFQLFLQFKFFRAFKLFVISLALGIISLSIGFLLGNQ